MEETQKKPFYKDWTWWTAIGVAAATLWLSVSMIVGCASSSNKQDAVEVTTASSRFENVVKAPLPPSEIDIIRYAAITPNGSFSTGYYSQFLHNGLSNDFAYVVSEDNIVITPSSTYKGDKLAMGFIDYETSADPYERVYIYIVPNAAYNWSTNDYSAFSSWLVSTLDESTGYTNGYNNGYEDGQKVGYDNGYNVGYTGGYSDGLEDKNTTTLTETFVYLFQAPFDQIYRFFNFNILGVNILALAASLVTVGLVIYVVKKLK